MARCPNCQTVVASGCNCNTVSTDCLVWSGDGSADDPYVLDFVLSADGDQLASCTTSGLFAEVPASVSEPPTAQAYRSSHQSIANNTLTTVVFNVELWDTDTMYSTATNTERLTFTTAGTYIVTACLAWNKDVDGDRIAQIRKGGTDILAYESKDSGGADLIVGHSLVVQDSFAATNYIEARVQHTGGAALLLLSESYSPIFTAVRMGPA